MCVVQPRAHPRALADAAIANTSQVVGRERASRTDASEGEQRATVAFEVPSRTPGLGHRLPETGDLEAWTPAPDLAPVLVPALMRAWARARVPPRLSASGGWARVLVSVPVPSPGSSVHGVRPVLPPGHRYLPLACEKFAICTFRKYYRL